MLLNIQIFFRLHERLFVTCIFFTSTIYVLWSLINITLPVKSWVPYAINSKTIFWITYLYQCCGVYLEVLLYTATELLLTILMQHICTQLEIFIIRLFEITNLRITEYVKIDVLQEECNIVKDCVDHHVFIFSMEKQLNDIFGLLISLQFFVSVLNLCTTGFYITKVNASGAYFWFSIMIMGCFIFQIFTHCYLGEEITRKSLSVADEIYQMDCNVLSLETKQKLIMIMMRARRPIQLTGFSVVVLSIETFFKVLKASYSSYNLLRNTN
ncbi:odorant receptor Or1-like isoform X2 [Leptopilina boulardi]|uniref:odorant receptor Or1-like isoform X2 n=1 Tax=Leptopilina boulardi TaxID=63433 RepID=UPI0021F59D4E|nr:odorant receptor Or1-like isoform X2 [Leptopilina boulardi]